jgi:hypothetical protein
VPNCTFRELTTTSSLNAPAEPGEPPADANRLPAPATSPGSGRVGHHGGAIVGRTLVTVKGDRVEVLVDIGESVRQFDVEATKAGRRVEVSSSRGMIEVVEVTRTGQPVRSARFMSTRVVAIVEHPSE